MYSVKRALLLDSMESGDQDGQMPVMPLGGLLIGSCVSLGMWAIIGFVAWKLIKLWP